MKKLFIVKIIFLFPLHLFAWGELTHQYVVDSAIRTAILDGKTSGLLLAIQSDASLLNYAYGGSIAPDFCIVYNYFNSPVSSSDSVIYTFLSEQHSRFHNPKVIEYMWANAVTIQEKAFVVGYASHRDSDQYDGALYNWLTSFLGYNVPSPPELYIDAIIYEDKGFSPRNYTFLTQLMTDAYNSVYPQEPWTVDSMEYYINKPVPPFNMNSFATYFLAIPFMAAENIDTARVYYRGDRQRYQRWIDNSVEVTIGNTINHWKLDPLQENGDYHHIPFKNPDTSIYPEDTLRWWILSDDDPTTYVSTNTDSLTNDTIMSDVYKLEPLSVKIDSSEFLWLYVKAKIHKSGSGLIYYRPFIRENSIETAPSDWSVIDATDTVIEIKIPPFTGSYWTTDQMDNNFQVGISFKYYPGSSNTEIRCSKVEVILTDTAESITSIADFQKKRCYAFSFPNPVRDKFTIVLENNYPVQNPLLQLYGLSGNSVKKLLPCDVIETAAGGHQVVADLSGLPRGVYIYNLVVNNAVVVSGKLVLI